MKNKNVFLVFMMFFLTLGLFSSPQSVKAEEEKASFSVLLLGVDTGDLGRVEQGRSDVMVLMTVDAVNERIVLTSIPRDSYVEIPDRGYMDKVNHAYAFGGAELSVDTINQWLGTQIEDYVAVNMAGLQEMVETVGGIEVVPPTTFTQGEFSFVEGQPIHLNGEGALAYVRNRYDSGGDYGRQGRQREVIMAIIKQAVSIDSLLNAPKIMSTLSENIDTNYNVTDLLALFNQYRAYSDSIETFQLTGNGQMIDGVYYEVIDESSLNELKNLLQNI